MTLLSASDTPAAARFEDERDELLRRYERDGRYRPAGDYAPEAFAGLRQCFLPQLLALLDRHAGQHPGLRDALGVELSRPKASPAGGGPLAYDFDGLLLAERLRRRVARLRLANGGQPNTPYYFAALCSGIADTEPVRQQHHHFGQAVSLAVQLAGASTRACLDDAQEVTRAVWPLRAFLPPSPAANLPNSTAALNAVSSVGWPPAQQRALADWRNACFRSFNTEQLAHLRQWHQGQVQALKLSEAGTSPVAETEADALIRDAQRAVEAPDLELLSTGFLARFFALHVLPAGFQLVAVRLRLGVAALYAFPGDVLSKNEVKSVVGNLQRLVLAQPALQERLLAEMLHWTKERQLGADFHEHLSPYLVKETGCVLRSLNECLAAVPEHLLDATALAPDEDVAQVVADVLAALHQHALPPAGQALLAYHLRQPLRQVFDRLDLVNDFSRFSQLYDLLLPALEPDEQWLVRALLAEQALGGPDGQPLCAGRTPLHQAVRAELRQRLADLSNPVGGENYEKIKFLLLEYSHTTEEHTALRKVLTRRYDLGCLLMLE